MRGQLTVQAGKRLQVPEPGATAAISLDGGVAAATMAGSMLTIVGIGPGDVRVVVLFPGNTIAEIALHVTPSEPVYPPGFVAPPSLNGSGGSEELRFSTDRMQFENVLDFNNRGPVESSQLHVISATLPSGTGGATTTLPSAFYRVSTPKMDLTLLDQTVNNSPLTLDNVILRGLHLRYGPWQFHGGYTDSADFADVLVPTQKEFAAGLSYRKRVGRYVTLVPQLYFVHSIDQQDGRQRTSPIGSVLLKIDFAQDWKASAEFAAGRGTGYALRLDHMGANGNLHGELTQKGAGFPSVRTASLPGLTANVNWMQTFSPRFGAMAGVSRDNLALPAVRQGSGSAFAELRFKLSQHLSFSSGANYGTFSNPSLYTSRTLTLPQQINLDWAKIGVGFQYQIATASHAYANGSGERQTLRVSWKRLQMDEFVGLQKDAVSVSQLTSELPQLQTAFARQSFLAMRPDQMLALLRKATFFETLGAVTEAELQTVPERTQAGADLSWNSTGPRPHQLSLAASLSDDRYAGGTTRDYNGTASYLKQLGTSNQLLLSASAVESSLSGRRQLSPVLSVSLRHSFSRAPQILELDRNYSIRGTVFVDTKGHGIYEDDMRTLPQVAVVLDGEKMALTDAMGGFRFSGLSPGSHRVQVRYRSMRAHYFTTPEDTMVESGSVVNFGIGFPTLDLWGYVEDDAGNGLENVQLRIADAAADPTAPVSTVTTDKSGKFLLADVRPGTYRVEVDAESVPIGHATEELTPVDVTMTANSAMHPVIRIAAVRVLSGTVTRYDPGRGQYQPVKDATVSIPQLLISVQTDRNGRFTIGALPSGRLDLKISVGPASFTQSIVVPAQPCTLREDYRVSPYDGAITNASGVKR